MFLKTTVLRVSVFKLKSVLKCTEDIVFIIIIRLPQQESQCKSNVTISLSWIAQKQSVTLNVGRLSFALPSL